MENIQVPYSFEESGLCSIESKYIPLFLLLSSVLFTSIMFSYIIGTKCVVTVTAIYLCLNFIFIASTMNKCIS